MNRVDDWNNLERQFGGDSDTLAPELIEKHNSNIWLTPDDLLFSDESKIIVCRALCNEIKVYKQLILRAQNLDKSQVRESLQELEAKCPLEADDEFLCPQPMPDISVKVKENRGPDHR